MTLTRSQVIATDVAALLRARNPLLWIVTREEARVERFIAEAAAAAGYRVTRTWDVAQGFAELDGTLTGRDTNDPGVALDEIKAIAQGEKPGERTIWIMRDLGAWLSGPIGAITQRRLRNLARLLPGVPQPRAQAIVVLSAGGDVPAELTGHATVIDWPLPDRQEIAEILEALIAGLSDDLQATAAPNGQRDAAIDAAVGLAGEEAQACYAKSLVQLRRIDPAAVAQEKKRVIARERVLEWYDPLPGGLAAVGGLDNLKAWLVERAIAYSPAARAYGLPAPKGALLVGVPGCGKSLCAKAIATAWGVPLLRVDLGALKSKYVGESEGNLRKALRVPDAIGRCVVWFDEIDKALPSGGAASADGGVSADALGTILTWMQERTGEAFVLATANDVTGLPPELLRKGRWDDLWWIDLPTSAERAAIMAATLRTHNRDPQGVDLAAVAAITDGYTGAEIAALVPDAMFAAFADGEREIGTADLVTAAGAVVPLSRMAEQKIAQLRAWAEGKARPASPPEQKTARVASGRQIDL